MTNLKLHHKPLGSIHPKWRLMLLMLVASLSFIIYDLHFYLANILITFFLSYNIGYAQLCKPIGSYFYLLLIIFMMQAILGDWISGIMSILRFCNIAIFASLIMLTTSHSDMIEGLECLLKPLSHLGLKPSKISMAFVLAIRFMPLIIDVFKEVKTAQKAKGLDGNFFVILIPLVIKTIKMADNIAEAIEARSWE